MVGLLGSVPCVENSAAMLLVVGEMLRSIASPSYVPRESVTVCGHEEEQRQQDASLGLKFEGQKSFEVRVTFACEMFSTSIQKVGG